MLLKATDRYEQHTLVGRGDLHWTPAGKKATPGIRCTERVSLLLFNASS